MDHDRRQQPKATGRADGVWAVETEGEGRGTSKLFFRVPIGGEMCGPCFTPDDKLSSSPCSIRARRIAEGNPASLNKPATRWPDFDANVPTRPSVVVITKDGGGVIGG